MVDDQIGGMRQLSMLGALRPGVHQEPARQHATPVATIGGKRSFAAKLTNGGFGEALSSGGTRNIPLFFNDFLVFLSVLLERLVQASFRGLQG
jgi:hypothetical protein